MDTSGWFYVKWWRWTVPNFLETCLNKRNNLILTIGLKNTQSISQSMDTSRRFYVKWLRSTMFSFLGPLTWNTTTSYGDDHEHLKIFCTRFFLWVSDGNSSKQKFKGLVLIRLLIRSSVTSYRSSQKPQKIKTHFKLFIASLMLAKSFFKYFLMQYRRLLRKYENVVLSNDSCRGKLWRARSSSGKSSLKATDCCENSNSCKPHVNELHKYHFCFGKCSLWVSVMQLCINSIFLQWIKWRLKRILQDKADIFSLARTIKSHMLEVSLF